MTAPAFITDDGGRSRAGFKGEAGDCAVRAAAIVLELPYRDVYDRINELGAAERRRSRKPSNARLGVWRETMTTFMAEHGYVWTPLMHIGSGCTTHVTPNELPAAGRYVLRLSRHYAAWVDGALHDTHDCSRMGTRCVYGMWGATRT